MDGVFYDDEDDTDEGNEEAETTFPGFKTIKPYLRTTKQPV